MRRVQRWFAALWTPPRSYDGLDMDWAFLVLIRLGIVTVGVHILGVVVKVVRGC